MINRPQQQQTPIPYFLPGDDPDPEDGYHHLIPDIMSRMQEKLPVTEEERRILRQYQDNPEDHPDIDHGQWPTLEEEHYLEAITGLERQA